jgi:hypothetical protein
MKYPLCILAFFASTALATDRWFFDVKAASENGYFLAKAESPDNRKKHPEPFAQNFTFTLADTRTHQRLWRYKGGPDSEPAGALFVSNSGRVISLGGWNGLTLFRLSGARIALPDAFKKGYRPVFEARLIVKRQLLPRHKRLPCPSPCGSLTLMYPRRKAR